MTPISNSFLQELEERARKATPGPWVKVSDLPDYGVATTNQPDFHPDPVVTLNRKYRAPWRKNLGCSEGDAAFIAQANPDTVLSLVEAVRKLKECVEFYADGRKLEASDPYCSVWEGWNYSSGDKHPIEAGERARATLKAVFGEESK